jgi:hypothetical protein
MSEIFYKLMDNSNLHYYLINNSLSHDKIKGGLREKIELVLLSEKQ